MSETKKLHLNYRNILGDAKETIEAIQKYIKDNARNNFEHTHEKDEELNSLNRVLDSVTCEETKAEINSGYPENDGT